jgi:phosphopantothenoylcysteine decarboxylase / phosphopantothenate---cysteine ligase
VIDGKTIILGVTGGIAAYKSAELVSKLKKAGATVHVIMTENATKFITPLTMQTLSENPVTVGMFDVPNEWEIGHISLAKKADLILVAPATANVIGKVANGIADDMLSTTIMATKAPVVFAPAMNDKMYENPIVQENIRKLEKHGYKFIEPEFGRLACGTEGKGRLAHTDAIMQFVEKALPDKTITTKR